MSEDIQVQITEGQDINISMEGCATSGLNASDFIYDEIPTGNIDGNNKLFTTANEYRSSKLIVKLNGLTEINFTEKSSTTFELDVAPLTGDCVTVDYIKQ